MTAFNLLYPDHLMVGADLHDAIMAPNWSTKIPLIEHLVAAPLQGFAGNLLGSVLYAPRVQARGAATLKRGTCIGIIIPHVPPGPNVLVPVIMADSKSKSLFGAGTVRVEGRPVAVAVFSTWSLNLNCGEPVRLPSGHVEAPHTVRAGMTAGDLFAGIIEMIFEVVYGFVKSKLVLDKIVLRVLGRFFPGALTRLLKSNPTFKALFEKITKIPLGKLVQRS